MRKKNPLMKWTSWVFIIEGLLSLLVIMYLWGIGGGVLGDFFEVMNAVSIQSQVFMILIILIRVMIGVCCLAGTGYDLCLCLAFILVIKDIVYMSYFYATNIYVYLYRSIPEVLLIMIYLLGALHFKYRET